MAMFLAILPVLTALALPPRHLNWAYLDVPRVDQAVSPNIAVVVDWQHDFAKLMRYSRNPQSQYYFLLDWPVALVGPGAFVVDYHLMAAYRDAGYYSQNIQDNDAFLCSHSDFLVLDSQAWEALSWFDLAVRKMPQFEWRVLSSFDALGVSRKLISVHRTEPLPFCKQP
jgi:hypothetical protein